MQHDGGLKLYFLTFAALMVLTVITVAVAFVDFGTFNVFLAIAIACVKATLVILFFMHVIESPHLIKITVAAGFLWLFILFSLTLSDYFTRDRLVSEKQSWIRQDATHFIAKTGNDLPKEAH